MNDVFDGNRSVIFNEFYLCKKFNSLPYGGGLSNQPARKIEQWEIIEATVTAHQKLNEGKSN